MITESKKIYILVKTYPTISETYSELVCTAGLLEDGSWIRLYPVPFRLLKQDSKYPKYTWITASVMRNLKDFRPESYRPVDYEHIHVFERPSKADWDERRRIISKAKIYTNLNELICDAKSEKRTSLAVFKPSKILDLIVKQTKRNWDKKKLENLVLKSRQLDMFKTIEEQEEEFRVVQKVPYKFSYKFIDDEGHSSTLMIEDWEIGMLYINCLNRHGGDEEKAIEDVKKKYLDEFTKRDIMFFMGTTLKYHNVSLNPFVIIGVFYPPFSSADQQMSIFDLL